MQHYTNNIFLNASAGSGKTFALCIRYIALLFQDVRANEILTLTFTKKAANEMKERITNNLFLLYITQANNHEIENLYNKNDYEKLLKTKNDILNALKEYDISSECVEKKITKVYKNFLQADNKISTIDSFFNMILRKFAFFIGIRRDFQLQEKGMNDQIFESFLKVVYKNPNLTEIMNSLTIDLNLKVESRFNNTLTLKELLATFYDKSIEFATKNGFTKTMQPSYTLKRARDFVAMLIQDENAIDTLENDNISNDIESQSVSSKESVNLKKETSKGVYHDILYHIDSIINNKDLQPNIEYVQNHITQIAFELSDLLKSIAPNGEIKTRIKDICKKLESGDIKTILTHKLVVNKTHNFVKQDLKPNLLMESEIAKLCTKIQNLGILYFMYYESALLAHIYLLMGVYTQITQEIETQENTLNFQSITHKVFAITTDTLQNNSQFQSDYFYFRLDSTISHILFDEYQDTSIIQYRIFLPIFQEILSGSGTKDSKSLFFVGDSKQSLYAFRGANICVFENTRNLDSIKQQSLQHNYRSKKAVIDFVNDKFSPIYKDEYLQQLYGQQQIDEKEIDEGVVSVKLYGDSESKNNSKDDKQEQNAIFAQALQQINTLTQANIPKKEIAILARKRDTLQNFVTFAKEQKSELLFNIDKNGKLVNQHSIQAIYYAFKTQYYREQIRILESTLAKLQEENSDVANSKDKNTKDVQDENSNIQSLQNSIKTMKDSYKFSQKKLNKLLGKSYFDNQHINIPKKQSLAQSIKSIIESCQLYNQDCIELLEIASENIQIKTIEKLFELIENKDSIVMQEEAINAMSVHGSKGLGFQYVIYLDYEEQKNNNANKIFYDYKDTFLQHIRVDTTKSEQYLDKTLKILKDNKTQEDINQEYNNLYVACTRAKNGLYIFANARSAIAKVLNLQTQEDYGKFIAPSKENSQKQKDNPIIISKLKVEKAKQEEFLQDTKSIYQHNIAMQQKQMIGIGLHYCLELMLGYGVQKPREMINYIHGFYLNDDCIGDILKKAQNIYKSQLEKLLCLEKSMIKCEVSFLQENSIKRLDAIVQRGNGFSIIEFKSSQNISEALLQSHTTQLQSYMECIANIFQNTKQMHGYLVYLQDNIAVKEIKLYTSQG